MNYTKEKKEFEKEFVKPKSGLRVVSINNEAYLTNPKVKDIWNWITQVFAKRVERKLIKKIMDYVVNTPKHFPLYKKEIIVFLNELKKQ